MVRKYKRLIWDKEVLTELYWGRRLSMALIAQELGTTSSNVSYTLHKFGIPTRTDKEALRIAVEENRNKVLKGSENPNWKGGRTSPKTGYIGLAMPNHPKANKVGYVWEHIVVWEEANGKVLPEDWVVHHLNGIRNDNRKENLMAMPRKNHHYALLLQSLRKRIRDLEGELKGIKGRRSLI